MHTPEGVRWSSQWDSMREVSCCYTHSILGGGGRAHETPGAGLADHLVTMGQHGQHDVAIILR